MNMVFLLSVILKGAGALVEVILQIMITRQLGVSGYGDYSTWVSMASLVVWMLFSGQVKNNTFYLSGGNYTLRRFKRSYYYIFVLPVVLTLALISWVTTGNVKLCLVCGVIVLETAVLDRSSTLLATGRAKRSLIGEYVLGRVVLVTGVCLFGVFDGLSMSVLMALYLVQYGVVLLFLCKGGKQKGQFVDISERVSLKKLASFQISDFMYAIVTQMPVVVQYCFSGAFEAGVVSIVLLVKKLINFISGPTSKIFLPEFSRLYKQGKREEIRKSFADILQLQMIFVGPLAVILLAFPRVVLRILAEELIPHERLFQLCALAFLATAMLGPCSGLLLMTGNERKNNWCRMLSVTTMILVMIVFRKNGLFVLYGLFVQNIVETLGKYACACCWVKRPLVGICTYLKWWLIPGGLIVFVCMLKLQESFIWMIIISGGCFLVEVLTQVHRESALRYLRKK